MASEFKIGVHSGDEPASKTSHRQCFRNCFRNCRFRSTTRRLTLSHPPFRAPEGAPKMPNPVASPASCERRLSLWLRAPPPSGCAPQNPPHSGRPRFQLVTQPENPSVSLTRPFAPATMLGLAPLALRVWAYANGRPLHSGPSRLRDKKPRPRVPPFFAPLPRPVTKTCRVWLPLEKLRRQTRQTWLPR